MRDRTINRLKTAAMSVTAVILAAGAGCHGKKPLDTRSNLTDRPVVKPADSQPASAFESDPEVMSLRQEMAKTQAELAQATAQIVANHDRATTLPTTTQSAEAQPADTQPAADDKHVSDLKNQLLATQGVLDARLADLQSEKDRADRERMTATSVPTTTPVEIHPTTLPDTMPSAGPAGGPVSGATSEPTSEPTTVPTTEPTTQTTTQSTTGPTTGPTAEATSDAPFPTIPDFVEADSIIGEQMAGIAMRMIGSSHGNNPILMRYVTAELAAAQTLDPTNARFARLQADACKAAGDTDGEIAALAIAVELKVDDEASWIRLLDLRIDMDGRADDAKAKSDWLSRQLDKPYVPADVKAHVAYVLAQTLIDRGEDDLAGKKIDEGLRLNPVSFELLALKLSRLPTGHTQYEELKVLLDLLRANPMQPRISLKVADMVAQVGLAQESLEFYQLTDDTVSRLGGDDSSIQADMAAEMFILGLNNPASRVNTAVLQKNPVLTSALFLQLVMERAAGNNAQVRKIYDQANVAFSNRVIEASNKSEAVAKATTRPVNIGGPVVLPDLAAVANKLKTSNDEHLRQDFIESVSDLALLKIYFGETPVDGDPLVDALEIVLPQGSPEIARLRGWSQLRAGKVDQAKATLTSVARIDPIAAMGLVKILSNTTDPAQLQDAEKVARKLIQDHPAGVFGAILKQGMENVRVKLITPLEADPIQKLVASFPQNWEHLAASPMDFYSINARPTNRGVAYGEPLLAELTIANSSDQPLTVGIDGIVKPQLLFRIGIGIPDVPPAYSFDRYAGPIVIQHQKAMTQTVRVDQSQVLSYLDQIYGLPIFEIDGTVVTNQTAPGALAAQKQAFTETYIRLATQKAPKTVDETLKAVSGGRPDAKIAALSLCRAYWMMNQKGMQAKNPPAALIKETGDIQDAIDRARADPIPAVSAWANYCYATIIDAPARERLFLDLIQDPDWRHRQVALLLALGIDPKVAMPAVKQMQSDPQSCVRAGAQTLVPLMLDMIAHPRAATTEPTTMPTTQPTTMPSPAPAPEAPIAPATMPTTIPTTLPAGQ